MIRRILTIASLTMRAAVRSRFVASLVLILLCVIIAVPATIRGDGTLVGQLQVLLHYTLGLAAIVLSIATLWAACGSISRDIEDRRIRLIAVKPVRKGEIWLGKWLGLMTLNAMLLLAVGGATYAFVAWRVRGHEGGSHEREEAMRRVLTGQRRILPIHEHLEQDARSKLELTLARLESKGRQIASHERDSLAAFIRRGLLAERAVVSAGQVKTWVFEVPQGIREGVTSTIRVNVSPVSDTIHPESGIWEVMLGDRVELTDSTELVQSSGRISLHGKLTAGTLRVSYSRPRGRSAIIFDLERPVELLVAEHSFIFNLCCSLWMVFCRLAVLTALGLAAGTLFSFPVATFLSMSIVFLAVTGHSFTVGEKTDVRSPLASIEREESVLYKVGEALIVRLESVAGPALRSHPFADLSDGILITGRALREAGLLMVLYVFIFALVSSVLLGRRELAFS